MIEKIHMIHAAPLLVPIAHRWGMIRPPKIWQTGILCHIWHIQISILVINCFARIVRLRGGGAQLLCGVVVEWYLSTVSNPFVWLMRTNLVLSSRTKMPQPLRQRLWCAGFTSRSSAKKEWARSAISLQPRSTSRIRFVQFYTTRTKSHSIHPSDCFTHSHPMPQRQPYLMWSLSATICCRISKVPMVSYTSRLIPRSSMLSYQTCSLIPRTANSRCRMRRMCSRTKMTCQRTVCRSNRSIYSGS